MAPVVVLIIISLTGKRLGIAYHSRLFAWGALVLGIKFACGDRVDDFATLTDVTGTINFAVTICPAKGVEVLIFQGLVHCRPVAMISIRAMRGYK